MEFATALVHLASVPGFRPIAAGWFIAPGDVAGGDVYMVTRMAMDPAREFTFIFDDDDPNATWTLTPL